MGSRSKDVKYGLVRAAFTQGLFKPNKNDKGVESWGSTFLWPKSQDFKVLQDAAVEAAVAEWSDKAVQMIKDGVIKSPFLDGDGKQGKSKKTGEAHPGFPGNWFIRVQSGIAYRPKLVNRQVLPIASQDEFYSGCYCNIVVNAFTWENKENGKGISFGLSMAQFVKDGEKLGGGGAGEPEEYFEKLPDEGAAPESTKTGAGAGGLFG